MQAGGRSGCRLMVDSAEQMDSAGSRTTVRQTVVAWFFRISTSSRLIAMGGFRPIATW